ncbi:MAG: ERAP1-like C-terminal domain-containing protein, partial [Myxococcota bacterium]
EEPWMMRAQLSRLFKRRFAALGFKKREADATDTLLLRQELAELMLFAVRDEAARKRALALATDVLQSDGAVRSSSATSDVEALVLGVLVQEQPEPTIARMVERLAVTTSSPERRTLLGALSWIEEPGFQREVRALVLDDRLRANERLPLLRRLTQTREGVASSWLWLRENFDALIERLNPEDAGETPFVAQALCDARALASIDEFFAERIDALDGGPRNLLATLEQVELCIAQKKVLGPETEAYFNRTASLP